MSFGDLEVSVPQTIFHWKSPIGQKKYRSGAWSDPLPVRQFLIAFVVNLSKVCKICNVSNVISVFHSL